MASLNKSWLISSISTSQGVGKLGDSVTSIEMQVEEVFKADEDATAIASALADAKLDVTNWKAQNADLLTGLNGQSISSIMIQVFVIIAVSLGIASVLAITVVQKSRDRYSEGYGFEGFSFQPGLPLPGIVSRQRRVVGIAFGFLLILMFSTSRSVPTASRSSVST